MNWLRSNQRIAWIAGISIAVVLGFYLSALIELFGLRQSYQQQIDRLAPRAARLQGLVQYEDELRQSAGRVREEVVNIAYPASSDSATLAAGLQKQMRRILVDAGLSVSNSQVLPVRQEGVFDYIGLKLTVSGDVGSLDAALTAMSEYSPLVVVESLDLRPARGDRRNPGKVGQVLNATMQLFSLRAVQ